jgi:CheY-like chemotaxis protein
MRRILVVEDDPLVGETILCVLEEQYRVTLASSVCGAAACLRDGEFDIVLLDCILPGGGVADLIAQAERLGVSVVLTSGDPEQIEAQGSGKWPFLAKPFSMNRLLDLLATIPSAESAPLPHPSCLPEINQHIESIQVPRPIVLRSAPLGWRSWPAVLTRTACAVALHVAAMTLFALTRAPAAAGSAPRLD